MIAMRTTLLIALLGALLAAGCGWHLRGASDAPGNIESLHISARNLKSDLVEDLRRALVSNGITVAKNATEAKYSLVLLAENSDRRTASIGASARVAELMLTESADFLILAADGTQVLGRTTVTTERLFEYNEDNVLATDDEALLLRAEMRSELVRKILNRLRFVSHRTPANAPAP